MTQGFNYDYLVIAYRLSILTFYIGVLIYALPLPWDSIKKWAPTLIQDSVASLILLLLLSSLLELSNRVAGLIGGSWEYFGVWIKSSLVELTSLKAVLTLIESLPNVLGTLTGMKTVVKSVDRLVTTALYFFVFIYSLSWIVKSLGTLLLSIGVALYAVPFRISKSAGAWLIAFILVFSAGFQVMPVFLHTLSQNGLLVGFGPIEKYGVALANITVYSQGGRIGDGVLNIILIENNKIIAVRPVTNGYAKGAYFRDGVTVPSKAPVEYRLEYLGVQFNLTPYPAYPSNYTQIGGLWWINLSNPYLVYSKQGVLLYTTGVVENISINNDITSIIYLNKGDYIKERHVDSCSATLEVSPATGSWIQGSWEWAGLKGNFNGFVASQSGYYRVHYIYSCGKVGFPRVHYKAYAGIRAILESFMSINIIEGFILYYFTFPSLYLLLLYSITFSLARVLGGRDRFRIRIF